MVTLHPILSNLARPPVCSFCSVVVGADGRMGAAKSSDLERREFDAPVCGSCLGLATELVESAIGPYPRRANSSSRERAHTEKGRRR